VQQACPFPPQAPQLALPHACPVLHATQTVPPVPQAASLVPGSQVTPEQQPPHDVASHPHTPAAHRWPGPHVPDAHLPPQPSSALHALPLQLGLQPHTPGRPAPPHESGAAQALPPAQHGCPFPPQMPQSVPHVCPLAHVPHATPPMPQAALVVPLSHASPWQQPAHDVTSQAQVPATQRCPWPHAPAVQTPSQPLLAPHALPLQLG
jgi:hypothetical protein